MFRLGVNSRFSWGLEVCLTYGMATHKIVGQPPMANAIMGAKTWSVQARSAVKQHNSHHLCRSAFRIVSMCLMLKDALGHKVLCLLSRIVPLMCLVEAGLCRYSIA